VKKLDGFHTFFYTQRVTVPGLERYQERRIRADLLFAYKLLFGFTALRADDYFNLSVCTATRGHRYKLFLTHSTDVRKYIFSVIVLSKSGMNELPSDTDFTSINSFQRRLTRVKLSFYCHHD